MGKRIILLIAASLLTLSMASFVSAVEFRVGDELFLDAATPLSDDLYISGGTVTVVQEVRGDLVIAGGVVTIDGNVSQDVIVAGGKVVINGNVGDDLRVAGGQVEVTKKINGDVLMFGGMGIITKEALVGGDVVIAGGSFDIKGDVGGSLEGTAGRLAISGNIAKDVDVTINGNLIITEQARIGGNLNYKSPVEIKIDQKNVIGNINFKKFEIDAPFTSEQLKKTITLGFISYKLFIFCAYLLLALIFILIAPIFMINTTQMAKTTFWRSLGIGALTVIALIAAILIAFVSGVGFFIGILLSAVSIILFLISQVFVGMIIGSFVIKTDKKSSRWKLFASYLIGLLLYTLLVLIPIVGWVVALILYLTAVGTFFQAKLDIWSALQKRKVI